MTTFNLSASDTLLVLDTARFVDQDRLRRNNPHAEENIASLLAAWRWSERPVIHIRRTAKQPTIHASIEELAEEPGELVRPVGNELTMLTQLHNAFVGTDLEHSLRQMGCRTVVVCGLYTHLAVSTNARMASDLGFKTIVVSDATAALERYGLDGTLFPAELVHQISLAALQPDLATVVTTEALFNRVMAALGRLRAGVVIFDGARLLLMYRYKGGREYYVVPGGGVEDGESIPEAAVREAKEETNLDVALSRQLWASHDLAHYFLVTEYEGDMQLGGPEAEENSDDNIYRLEWIALAQLSAINLVPRAVKQMLLQELLPGNGNK